MITMDRLTLIRSGLLALTLGALAACQDDAPAAGAIAVPSGREITLIEVLTHAPGATGAAARFRFLAPGLVPEDLESAVSDMQALCDGYALERTQGMVPEPQQIIISLAAEAVPFGQAAPGVVQFFEAYTVTDGTCIWEQF